MKILVLGGTAEARELATALAGLGHSVTTSLAGRTTDPKLPEGSSVRVGGFGGADGLAAYLRVEGFHRLVDATHPYALEISRNAVEAAAGTGIPLVRLSRLPWVEPQYAFWKHVPDFEAAARLLPVGARALLTIGHTGLEAFFARTDCTFLIRSIEPPQELPAHCWSIQSRPPYYPTQETTLMKTEKISHLVTKNSGGGQTEAKLKAAQGLGLTSIVIARPEKPKVTEVMTLGRCIAALRLDRY